jgi:hypothetical protein
MPNPANPSDPKETFSSGPKIEAISSIELGPPEDDKAELEFEALDLYREGKEELELRGLAQDIDLRGQFANRIFILFVGWLLLVLGVLFFQGFKATVYGHNFGLSDSVVLALIGSTTVNVIGVFVIVVHYLFPNRVTLPPVS